MSRFDSPYRGIAEGPADAMDLALAKGQSAASKGRFMVEGAAEQFTRRYAQRRPVQLGMRVSGSSEPELVITSANSGGCC